MAKSKTSKSKPDSNVEKRLQILDTAEEKLAANERTMEVLHSSWKIFLRIVCFPVLIIDAWQLQTTAQSCISHLVNLIIDWGFPVFPDGLRYLIRDERTLILVLGNTIDLFNFAILTFHYKGMLEWNHLLFLICAVLLWKFDPQSAIACHVEADHKPNAPVPLAIVFHVVLSASLYFMQMQVQQNNSLRRQLAEVRRQLLGTNDDKKGN